MADYTVPVEIRALRPEGTVVKNISGHYYVYERSRVKDEKGRWHTKSGAVIGTIKPGAGFIPREGRATDTDVTCVDYGQYATVIANSQEVLALLDKHFNKEDAIRIYACAIIHFVEGFCHMKGMKKIYDQSWLSLRWPFLKMGDRSLSSFYEVLGYRQTGVLSFEQALCDSGSGKLAIDGHVIGSCSWWNGLSQKGYRFNELKEMQMNMIMAYDVVHKMPVAVKVCEGGENDKLSVKELFDDVTLRYKLLIVDRGFYSESNIEMFCRGHNQYIIPVPNHLNLCKEAVADLIYTASFTYDEPGKIALVEYKVCDHGGFRVYVFHDKDEAMRDEANYTHMIELGRKGYTEEALDEKKPFFGLYVLRTNDSRSPAKDIFMWYKRRWRIETFYDFFSNVQHDEDFQQRSYYKVQGLAFILLVSSLVHREFAEHLKKAGVRESIQDVILDSRMIKLVKRGGIWKCENKKPSQAALLEKLGTSLSPVVPDSSKS